MQVPIPTESDPLPPAFTEQDQQRELATTCPLEIAKAEADVLGITSGLAGLGIKEAERDVRLRQLDEELSKIPDDQKAAYLEAVERCPEMVNDERKVAFLEREAYDAKLAAQRLRRYWETKLDVFGLERCFLPLTLQGAMKDELSAMLQYCPFQVLPVKDTSGRAIIFSNRSRRDPLKYSARQMAMGLWYMVETATEDPEVRKRGVVLLTCLMNMQRKHFDAADSRFIANLLMGILPVPVRSIHACHPTPVAYYLYPIVKYVIGKELRLRIKLHYGSTEKVLQELGSYCLPRDRVPSELGGDLVLDSVKWFNDQLELESKHLLLQGQHSVDGKADAKARPAKRLRSNFVKSKISGSTRSYSSDAPGIAQEKMAGRKSDPRMNRAILAKLDYPDMSVHEALIKGGFDFPSPDVCKGVAAEKILDSDNVSLRQRKNQLNRRIRQAKKRQHEYECSSGVKRGTGDDRPDVESSFNAFRLLQASSSGLEELPDVDVNKGSGAEKGSSLGRRDSFYECIMELPGLDDLDALEHEGHS